MKTTRLLPVLMFVAQAACANSSPVTNGAGGGGIPGGAGGGGGAAGAGGIGAGGIGAGGAAGMTPGAYALPPPSECSNQWSVQGCVKGNATSTCGGACSDSYGPTSKSACESGKPGVPVQYACPRFLLFADEMVQAAIDDGFAGKFNYAVVGHDPDTTNLDQGLPDSCCQCYQLVFDAPRYLTNSQLTPPKPLVVQSFNTMASGATGFDVFMGAGGLGAFNACGAVTAKDLSQGYALYTAYPNDGQAFNGGVKPGPDSLKCDSNGNLTDALISASTCQAKVTTACNSIKANNATVQRQTQNSCIQSNQATSYYHENWKVYAKRVICPEHLTQVTGCKLAAQSGIAAPDPNIQTAAQAAAAGFKNTLNNEPYHTTTMQDCCMPTCSWKNNVKSATVNNYNSFYSCLDDGTPVVQK